VKTEREAFPFAAFIRWLLTDKAIQQDDLADLAEVGPTTVNRWKEGESLPSPGNLERLAKGLRKWQETDRLRVLFPDPKDAFDVHELCMEAYRQAVMDPELLSSSENYSIRRYGRREIEGRRAALIARRREGAKAVLAGFESEPRVREDMDYEITLQDVPRGTLIDGYRKMVSKISWIGELPAGAEVFASFVESEAELQKEFREPGCLYREVVKGIANPARRKFYLKNDLLAAHLSLELLEDDRVTVRETCVVPVRLADHEGTLRAYFTLPESIRKATRRVTRVTVEMTSPLSIGDQDLMLKFDGYVVCGTSKIKLTTPFDVRIVRHFEFTGSSAESYERKPLWDFKKPDNFNFIVANSADSSVRTILPGHGMLLTWPHRYEVLPFTGELGEIQHIHERSRALYHDSTAFVRRKPVLDEPYLDAQRRAGLLFGLYQVSRAPGKAHIDDEMLPVGFAACHWLHNGEKWDLHLEQLSILPELAGRRLGQTLVHRVLAVAGAAGADGVSLITFLNVPFCAPNYRRLGFAVVREGELSARQLQEFRKDIDIMEPLAGQPLTEARERVFMRYPLATAWKVQGPSPGPHRIEPLGPSEELGA